MNTIAVIFFVGLILIFILFGYLSKTKTKNKIQIPDKKSTTIPPTPLKSVPIPASIPPKSTSINRMSYLAAREEDDIPVIWTNFNLLKEQNKITEKDVKNEEYLRLMSMEYQEIVDYLKNKYGEIKSSYFANETCRSVKSGIRRGSEGLQIHHTQELYYALLSNKEVALKLPFEYQLGKNLCYCNFLEHSILHYKIAEYHFNNKTEDVYHALGFGYFNYTRRAYKDMLRGYEFKAKYWIAVNETMKDLHTEMKDIFEKADLLFLLTRKR